MFFVFGSRWYGKVDHVPGLFYVTTKFGHLNFVPLIPTETWLVYDDGSERGVPIGMSGRSIVVGWLRALLLVGGCIALVLGFLQGIDANTGQHGVIEALAVGSGGAAALGLFGVSYPLVRIGRERAARIAEEAGINPGWVHDHFDRLEQRNSNPDLDARADERYRYEDKDDGDDRWDRDDNRRRYRD